MGLYQNCSINRHWDEVAAYEAPKSANLTIGESGLPESKYKQRSDEQDWNGVVLALQRPKDRSIRVVGSVEDYYEFVQQCCEKWGPGLFLKEHPSGASERDRWMEMALRYGCTFRKVNHSVIKNCRFVILYNSSFAVDCFLRGGPVQQYAPGYFYKTPAVTYTDRTLMDNINHDVHAAQKLADFLIWRYCIDKSMPFDKWVETLSVFEKSKEPFPLPENLSYATNYYYSQPWRPK
jgi:hypothetical protein